MPARRRRLVSRRTVLASALAVAAAGPLAARALRAAEGPRKLRVFLGTSTRGSQSQGIYTATLDLASGKLSEPVLAAEAVNPSFLALHPSGKFLYATSEVASTGGKPAGGVAAFALDAASGRLTPLGAQSSEGAGPCHVVVDPAGKHVLVANYSGGSVAALPIGPDGGLAPATSAVQHHGSSVNPQRQSGPHAHSINLDAAGRFAFAADLGLDQVLVYRFDPATGKLTPNDPPYASVAPGAGPRHFAFHPSGKYAYVINELASTLTAFAYDAARGTLTEICTVSTLPEGFTGSNTTAEVQVHPSGKWVYGSNRGHDSIATFAVDPASGQLTPRGQVSTGGRVPRNFGVDPTGQYLLACNQDTDNVVVFRLHAETGLPEPTGQAISVPRPMCVKYLALPG